MAERFNEILLEKLRSMLAGARVFKHFWVEGLNTTYYLSRELLKIVIGFTTPMERWTRQALNFRKIKTFGCTSYAHIR